MLTRPESGQAVNLRWLKLNFDSMFNNYFTLSKIFTLIPRFTMNKPRIITLFVPRSLVVINAIMHKHYPGQSLASGWHLIYKRDWNCLCETYEGKKSSVSDPTLLLTSQADGLVHAWTRKEVHSDGWGALEFFFGLQIIHAPLRLE